MRQNILLFRPGPLSSAVLLSFCDVEHFKKRPLFLIPFLLSEFIAANLTQKIRIVTPFSSFPFGIFLGLRRAERLVLLKFLQPALLKSENDSCSAINYSRNDVIDDRLKDKSR